MLATIVFSFAALGLPASPLPLQRISKAYPLSQALRDGATHLINYNKTSGQLLEGIGSWLNDEHKEQLRNLQKNIDRHRQGQTFISAKTVESMKKLVDAQGAGVLTFADDTFLQLLNALQAEIAAEGLLQQVAKRLLDENKHDLLFDKLLTTAAITDEQLRQVLHEVLSDFTEEEAEELFKAAQQIIEKRNTAINTALADKKPRSFYAYSLERDASALFHRRKDGNLDSDSPFDERNIIVFGETTNGVKKRVRQQTVGKKEDIITKGSLPRGRDKLDKIVMKVLALTSDFRPVSILRSDGTENTETFVLVDGDGNIKDLAAEREFVREEVAKALAVVEHNYLYISFFSEQKIKPYLELSYKGADRLEFTKSAIIAALRDAEDPVQVITTYGVQLNDRDTSQQLADIYRAIEAVRDGLGEAVMDDMDAEFEQLISKEHKVINKTRKIPRAEITRQAVVLDLHDVTKDKFNNVSFYNFISGRNGIPKVVRNYFREMEKELSDNDLKGNKQWKVWVRLQQLDAQRKVTREEDYSLAKENIVAVLHNVKVENIAKVFATYGAQLNRYARQKLAELYRAIETVRDGLDKAVMDEIDADFEKLLSKEYKLRNKTRKIPLAEIIRQAVVLDLHDVTKDKFNKHIFQKFISGRNGIPEKVRKFFSTTKLTEAQQDAWERLQQLDVQRKVAREEDYSLAKENIVAVLQNVEKTKDIAEVFATYREQLNKYARQKLAELYRAMEAVRDELDEAVMDEIDADFEKLLGEKYKLRNKTRKIPLAEIARHAAVLDIHDVTEDEFEGVIFLRFISGKSSIPEKVRKFFSTTKLTEAQQDAWERLQQLDVQRKVAREEDYSLTKENIVAVLQNVEKTKDIAEVFATYREQLNKYARQKLAELYRAMEAVRDELDEAVMDEIDADFEKLLGEKYKIGNKTRKITRAEITRQAVVLDLQAITGDEFNKRIFNEFISGRHGIPEVVRDYFREMEKELSDNDLKGNKQWKVWVRLQQLDAQRKVTREEDYSFAKENIVAVLHNVNDAKEIAKVFAIYRAQLNQYARQQLAELYRAIDAMRDKLDDEVVQGIEDEFEELISKEYKIGNKARKIPHAEIIRQAVVLDLHDVTKDKFNKHIFQQFISGRNGIPEVVRDYFREMEKELSDNDLKGNKQWKVWVRLQQLDAQRKVTREEDYSFAKENIVAVLHNVNDAKEIAKVFATYGAQLNRYARLQLAELYRAIEVVRDKLHNTVMENIDYRFEKLLSKEYKVRNKTRKIPRAEIARQAAVLDLHDVTGGEFNKRIFLQHFISGRHGIPKVVRDYFREMEKELSDNDLKVNKKWKVWVRLQQLDAQRKAARE